MTLNELIDELLRIKYGQPICTGNEEVEICIDSEKEVNVNIQMVTFLYDSNAIRFKVVIDIPEKSDCEV